MVDARKLKGLLCFLITAVVLCSVYMPVRADETEIRQTETVLDETETEDAEALVEAAAETPLSAVEGITVQNEECKATLTWKAVEGAEGYRVYAYSTEKNADGTEKVIWTKKADTTELTYVMTGVQGNKSYFFGIVAYDADGEEGTYPEKPVEAKPTMTVPGKVTGLKAAEDENKVTLSWSAATSATGYKVYEVTASGDYKLLTSTKKTSYVITGLTGGQKYTYVIKPYRKINNYTVNGAYSSKISAVPKKIVPGKVENLQVKNGEGEIALTWTAPQEAKEYEIWKQTAGEADKKLVKKQTTTTYTEKGFDGKSKIQYFVRSVRTVNGYTTYSDFAEVEAAPFVLTPSAVKTLEADGGVYSVMLTWSKAANATGYTVYMTDPATGKKTAVTETSSDSYTVKSLDPKKTYTFSVEPFRKVNTVVTKGGASSEVKAAPKAIEAVTGFMVTNGECQISLNWNKVEGASYYEVEKRQVAEGTDFPTIKVETNSYTDKNLPYDESFEYSVRAVYDDGTVTGYSDYTPYSLGKTYILNPLPITNFKAVGGEYCVNLSWIAGTNATGYKIYLMDDTTKQPISLVSTKKTSYVFNNLKAGKSYTFMITSYRKIGTEVKHNTTMVSATAKPYEIIPDPIKNLTAKAGDHAAILSWDASKNATGYKIYMFDKESGEWKHLASTKKLTYTVSGLPKGEKVSFRVQPYRKTTGGTAYGKQSATVSATPIEIVPAKVSKVLFDERDKEVLLTWPKTTDAQGYNVYRLNKTTGEYEKIGSTTNLYFKDYDVVNDTTYTYKVRAYRKSGDYITHGAYSDPVNVTPRKPVNGWSVSNNKKYYYVNNKPVKGSQKIGGKYYYFDKTTGAMQTGWVYYNGYKYYHDKSSGARVEDVSSIIGKQSSYQIKVNKRKNCVTIYAKDGSKGYIIPVKSMICSTGTTTPVGTHYMGYRWRWLRMMGPSWGQWVTQIDGDYLFHSVYYNSENNNNNLSVSAYNNLGTTCSHGCVRLKAGDAKWIYDNVPGGTKIVIYNSDTVGPFERPTAYKLPSWHTWDPTDPNMAYKCKKNGCH